MTLDFFFKEIESQYQQNLPFVVYRKYSDDVLTGLLQNNSKLNIVNDFTESGFVMSPFDNESDTIIIPQADSKCIEVNNSNFIETTDSNIVKEEDLNSKQTHLDLIYKGISAIKKNEFEKVVLSRCELITLKESYPIKIFKSLLNNYPNAFVYCWFHPKVGLWLGATPETLLQVSNKRFKTMSLAGTKNFEGTLKVNWSSKEINEQKIVTDFIIEKLQTEISDLQVSDTETIKAGSLLHLRAIVSGRLNQKNQLHNILEKLHPTPAVCGYPTKEAKQFILANERYHREFYTGFLGEFNFKERRTRNSNKRNVENNAYTSVKTVTNLFVNLRCMQLKEKKALIYIGGGITSDSIPENEWQETVYKSDTIKKAL